MLEFSNDVTDIWMREKLAINDNLCLALELVNLVDRCAKDEEGRLFIRNDPDAPLDDSKTKGQEVKRKGPAVLAAEPQ